MNLFCVIPSEILRLKINSAHKILYALLSGLSDETGYIKISNSKLSESLNISARNVQKGLKKLENLGFLKVEVFDHWQRWIKLQVEFRSPSRTTPPPVAHDTNKIFLKDDDDKRLTAIKIKTEYPELKERDFELIFKRTVKLKSYHYENLIRTAIENHLKNTKSKSIQNSKPKPKATKEIAFCVTCQKPFDKECFILNHNHIKKLIEL